MSLQVLVWTLNREEAKRKMRRRMIPFQFSGGWALTALMSLVADVVEQPILRDIPFALEAKDKKPTPPPVSTPDNPFNLYVFWSQTGEHCPPSQWGFSATVSL